MFAGHSRRNEVIPQPYFNWHNSQQSLNLGYVHQRHACYGNFGIVPKRPCLDIPTVNSMPTQSRKIHLTVPQLMSNHQLQISQLVNPLAFNPVFMKSWLEWNEYYRRQFNQNYLNQCVQRMMNPNPNAPYPAISLPIIGNFQH